MHIKCCFRLLHYHSVSSLTDTKNTLLSTKNIAQNCFTALIFTLTKYSFFFQNKKADRLFFLSYSKQISRDCKQYQLFELKAESHSKWQEIFISGPRARVCHLNFSSPN